MRSSQPNLILGVELYVKTCLVEQSFFSVFSNFKLISPFSLTDNFVYVKLTADFLQKMLDYKEIIHCY